MKICAIICEYNPFHNGHLYQLNAAKELSGADAVLCVMSGNFVQRGEAAIADKYTRARHAILAGADAIIELPVAFATANAELFAKGAIHILSSIPSITHLCFGAENADSATFKKAAELLNNEPQNVSKTIKRLIKEGVSYAKARAQAFAEYIPQEFLSSPNNILGVEYTKALLSANTSIEILPIARKGGDYKDNVLLENYSSATAIRTAIQSGKNITGQLPSFVENDLALRDQKVLETMEKYAILTKSAQAIAKVCDCTEGLENALKRAATEPATLVESLTCARYTSSRIRRIALQNALQIDEILIRESLKVPLYLRILAIKKERKDVLSVLGESSAPIVLRAHDEDVLQGAAKACYDSDNYADNVYRMLYDLPHMERNLFI